ncbi:MAG: enoyl-CoA hydratase [Deltaproteobacteria bacterium]|nr:enoyl-CoA hydratase [Deltaproteobacteria bacterium]MBW2362811.1 enoyl-CoA hydratase [Deltaproteobacteria bacterium]
MPVIRVERSAEIATVVLNRPEAMNALSTELCDAIGQTFLDLSRASDVRAVILTGAGRAFSAGVDLKELASGERRVSQLSAQEMIDAVRNFPGPVIGAVNGFAITGGFELALACDFLIASRQARFADTHARVGILPGWGLSQKLPRLIGINRAKELSFTGNYLDAETACAWGLVNRVTEPDALLPTCLALAQDTLSCQPDTLRGYKRLIDDGFAMAYGDALAHEARESAQTMRQITAEDVANRREDVQARGRRQTSQ